MRPTVPGLILLSLLACSGPESESGAPLAGPDAGADGAGPFAEPGPAVDSLPAEPSLSLGGATDVGPTQFAGVRSVVVTNDGRIWVADEQSQEIRVFAPTGSHLLTLGGRGDGPGEFQQLRLAPNPGSGPVTAVDGRVGRVTTYSLDGELRETRRWVPRTLVRPLGIGETGAVLAVTEPGIPIFEIAEGVTYQDTARVLMWTDLEGAADTIARGMGLKFAWSGHLALRMPLTTQPGTAVWGDDLLIADPHRFRIDVVRAGVVIDSMGVRRPPRPTDASVRADAAAFREANFSESAARSSIDLLDHPDLPPLLPGYDEVVVTADGGVWARIWRVDRYADAVWDRFDRDGRFIGSIRTPPRFELHAVAGGVATGVQRDELGVEYLERYPIPPR